MTHEDAGRYAKKHPAGKNVGVVLADAIKDKATDQGLGCAQAEKIARDMGLEISEVGAAIDLLEIRITNCQLGLFGYPKEKFPEGRAVTPAKEVAPALEEAIRARLEGGRLPCRSAWEIASERGISKMAVSAAAEYLKIRIRPCQLGAF